MQRSRGSRKLRRCVRKSVWRRRADSNRRIEVLQTPALGHLATSPLSISLLCRQLLLSDKTDYIWCREWDSNPHALSSTTPST